MGIYNNYTSIRSQKYAFFLKFVKFVYNLLNFNSGMYRNVRIWVFDKYNMSPKIELI